MNEPRLSSELTEILAECLDAIDRGQKTPSQCLAAYPQFADELRPLLLAAVLTRKLKSPTLSDVAVDRMMGKVFSGAQIIQLDEADEDEKIVRRVTRPSRPRTAFLFSVGLSRLAATLLIAFLVSIGGTIAVSANSQPGDALYSVKRFWEDIILSLSPLTGSKSDLALHFARVRLEETERMAANGTLTEIVLIDLYEAVTQVIDFNNGDAVVLTPILDNAHQRLTAINPPVALADLHQDLLDATTPNIQNGIVQSLPSSPSHITSPSISITPTAAVTTVPTLTLESRESLSPTPTSTETPSPTSSPTLTTTPRIPPTPTRTPSPTPSPTLTLTPLPTLTLTWTPLPLPGTLVVSTLPPTLPPGLIPTETPYNLPTAQFTPRERETQQAVHMTQTAQASP